MATDSSGRRKPGPPKGSPQRGGRKKGTLNANRRELFELLKENLHDPDYHPVVELARLGRTGVVRRAVLDDNKQLTGKYEYFPVSDNVQIRAMEATADRLFPKLQSVEFQNEDDTPLTVQRVEVIVKDASILTREED